jgi:hypothetical protein
MVLIAFALQAYVTQTHIHSPPIPQIGVASAGSATAQAPTPADEETACPFCQAMAAAGAFVGPPPTAVTLPIVRIEADALPSVVIGLILQAAGFSWRSRAPPQL